MFRRMTYTSCWNVHQAHVLAPIQQNSATYNVINRNVDQLHEVPNEAHHHKPGPNSTADLDEL